MNVVDMRTLDIIRKYEYLKNNVMAINNKMWMDCVIELNRLQIRLF